MVKEKEKLTPKARICMAISWTTTEQKEAGGAREERLEGIPEPMRMCTGEPSIADMLEDKSPKIKDCKWKRTNDHLIR